MTVPAMRAGDVIIGAQRLADPHRHRLFPDVKVSQPRHKGARIEIVDPFLEQADGEHLAVKTQMRDDICGSEAGALGRDRHFSTPDMRARTSKTTAKSFFSHPRPRAALKNSLLTAVVGKGTRSARPNSIASSMSFCIMLQSNQASSGCPR